MRKKILTKTLAVLMAITVSIGCMPINISAQEPESKYEWVELQEFEVETEDVDEVDIEEDFVEEAEEVDEEIDEETEESISDEDYEEEAEETPTYIYNITFDITYEDGEGTSTQIIFNNESMTVTDGDTMTYTSNEEDIYYPDVRCENAINILTYQELQHLQCLDMIETTITPLYKVGETSYDEDVDLDEYDEEYSEEECEENEYDEEYEDEYDDEYNEYEEYDYDDTTVCDCEDECVCEIDLDDEDNSPKLIELRCAILLPFDDEHPAPKGWNEEFDIINVNIVDENGNPTKGIITYQDKEYEVDGFISFENHNLNADEIFIDYEVKCAQADEFDYEIDLKDIEDSYAEMYIHTYTFIISTDEDTTSDFVEETVDNDLNIDININEIDSEDIDTEVEDDEIISNEEADNDEIENINNTEEEIE